MVSARVPSQSKIKPLIIETLSARIVTSTLAFSYAQRRQLLLQIVHHERIDQRIDFAFNHVREIIEREFDAVIGHTVLRKIVGANFFAALAGANLVFALGGIFG